MLGVMYACSAWRMNHMLIVWKHVEICVIIKHIELNGRKLYVINMIIHDT